MANKNELWRGQKAQDIRSQFFGQVNDEKPAKTFTGQDQKTTIDVKSKQHQYQEKNLGVEERLARATKDIQNRIQEMINQSELDQTIDSAYLSRIFAFDNAVKQMPEQARSQVQKLAKAITREFNLDAKEKAAVTSSTTAVNPENLIASSAKDLLKSAPTEIMLAAPLIAALWVLKHMPPELKVQIASFYDRTPLKLRLTLVLIISTVLLAACATAAPTPRPEVTGANTPQGGEVAGGSGTATEEGVATEATGMSAEDLEIINTIQNDPYYRDSAYAKAKEATSGIEIPQACVDMTNELIARGEISAVTFVEVGVTSSANCYVTWEENGIRTVVFNSKDINGYLYVLFNPAEHEVGAQFEYKNAPHALWAAIMVGGQATEGVNGATHQWVKLVDGQLTDANGVPTPVATSTPVNAPAGEAHPVGQTLDEAAIAKLVEDYNNGTLTDLSSLTAEQLKAFDSARMTTLVEKYENGDREVVNKLNFEQRKAFSLALNEKRDEKRGSNPIIFTDRSGAKFYVDPVTLDFLPVGDGTTAEQQTIDNTKQSVIDDEGYIHVYHNGEWIRIEGSNKIQFNNFDNFPWPDTEIVDPKWVTDPNLLGLTIPEYGFKINGDNINMAPIFFLDKELGKTDIAGSNLKGTLLAYVITENDQFSVRAVMITGIPSLFGNNLKADVPGDITEYSDFYKAIRRGDLLYLMYEVDQEKDFAETYPGSKGKDATINYEGLAPSGQAHGIVTGEIDSVSLALINAKMLVKAGE